MKALKALIVVMIFIPICALAEYRTVNAHSSEELYHQLLITQQLRVTLISGQQSEFRLAILDKDGLGPKDGPKIPFTSIQKVEIFFSPPPTKSVGDYLKEGAAFIIIMPLEAACAAINGCK